MIVRNSDNVVLYGDGWVLTDSYATNSTKNIRDRSINTSNATFYDIPQPEPWNGGDHTYDGVSFALTEAGLKSCRSEAVSNITAIAYHRITSGIPFTIGGTEYIFKSDPSSLNMISTKAANFKSGITDPNSADPVEAFSGYWRTADNQNPVMTINEFYDLSKTCDLYVAGLAEREHVIKDTLIPVATTEAELDTIVSDYRIFDPLA